MPLTIGQVLESRYRIEALLGQGGMGAVYRAIDLRFNTPVAIKENLAATPEAQRQFGREAGLLHQLRHPNLPRVTDHFVIPGQGQYLVMDYIEGEDLGRILSRQGPIPGAQAISWIQQVLYALEYLHSQGIVHRDVKPANVKITPQGQVILVDFGLAKVYDPVLSTTVGARGVTPGFAPPEQYGTGRTDVRSDLYSVGATLYALLTGQTPPDALEMVTKQAHLIPPRQLNARVTPEVDAATVRAMQMASADRFQSVAEFRDALTRPRTTHKPPAMRRPPAPTTPAWLWPVVLAAAVVLVIVVAVWALGDGRRSTKMTTPTEPGGTGVPLFTATVTLQQTDTTPPMDTPQLTASHTSRPADTSVPTVTMQLPAPTYAQATATPRPTAPPTDTPKPGPMAIFEAVPLGGAANSLSSFLSPPTGSITLGGVAFELSRNIFKSQASPSPDNTYPPSISLSADIPYAYKAHLLLNTGNSFTHFKGKVIGQIVAYCDGQQLKVTDLILGQNIREWQAAEAKTVSFASRTQEVWSGVRSDQPTLKGYIDMLSLDLPESCLTGRLTALEVVDTSITTVGSLDPAINLTGVTVEHYQ